MTDTKALDVYIKNNGVCPIGVQERAEYLAGLGYFVEGWDEHEHQDAAELEEARKVIDEVIQVLDECYISGDTYDACKSWLASHPKEPK